VRVHVWRDRDVAPVEPTDDVDAVTIELFREALARARRIAVRKVIVVILDPALRFDVEALNEVLREHRQMRNLGGGVALVGVSVSLQRVLGLTALDGVLPIYGTLEGALRSLGSAPVR
jgi:anti-anti-sigma factor